MSEEFNKHEVIIKILESIEALAKLQENPFFNSKYVDLPSILREIKPILFKNECYLVQQISVDEKLNLKTQIIHKSGEALLECKAPLLTKDPNNPQSFGSALTYMKRYSLTSLLGIVENNDDDGNKATKTTKTDYLMMEVLNQFLEKKILDCQTADELSVAWKSNSKYFNKLKEESERDYKKLIDKATKLKAKLDKPTTQEPLTTEEKKEIEEGEDG